MVIKRIVTIAALSILSSLSYAKTVDFNLYGGLSFANLSNNSTLRINEDVTNRYRANSRTRTDPLFGIGIGHTFEKIFQKPWDISLGLSSYYLDLENVTGVEYPFVNAGMFDTLNYKFRVQSASLLVEPRLIYSRCDWQPYFIGGIGVAWNILNDYSERASNAALSAAPGPFFGSNTQAAFAYEVGAGVQHQFFHDQKTGIDYSASLDYRYMNFGKGQLQNFEGMTASNHLGVSTIDTQAVVLSLKVSV